jgi:hypothetical protein
MANRQIVEAIGVTKTGLVRSSIHTVMAPTDHSSCSIKLPDGALRNVNIECNAPLSSVNARVEKVSSMYGTLPTPDALHLMISFRLCLNVC